jgi:hypothetical protein
MDVFRLNGLRNSVRKHLTEHGARDWKLVKDQFADVPHATFWRTVKAVRQEGDVQSKGNEPSPQDPAADQPLLFPGYCEPLKKLAEYQSLIRSAQELIDQARGPGGKIKNWQMHAKGVALRESLVRNQVQVMADLVNQDVMEIFSIAVLDVVDEAAPAVLPRVVARFRELHGMSPEQLQTFTAKMKAKNEMRNI